MIGPQTRVVVVRIVDEIGDLRYIGQRGTVVRREVRSCGASPRDPMLIVRLDASPTGEHADGFWLEEVRELR